jgi:hypothetical protein
MARLRKKAILLFFQMLCLLFATQCGLKLPPRPYKHEAGHHASLVEDQKGEKAKEPSKNESKDESEEESEEETDE